MADNGTLDGGGRVTATLNDWTARFDQLSRESAATGLSAEDFGDLGLAAWFIGRTDESERAWDTAHRAYLEAGDVDAAVRCVFWIGYTLSEQGDDIRGGAWMSRLFELWQLDGAGPASEALVVMCRSVAAFARGQLDESAALAQE